MSVTSAVQFAAEPFIFVRDERKLSEPPREVRLNEPLDDGTLVLIHRTGTVVRVMGRNPADPAKLYFYALGKRFTEREELSAGKNAELFQLEQGRRG